MKRENSRVELASTRETPPSSPTVLVRKKNSVAGTTEWSALFLAFLVVFGMWQMMSLHGEQQPAPAPSTASVATTGWATPEGTARFAARHSPHQFRSSMGLTLSTIGMGTYLGDADDMTDRAVEMAVLASVSAGVNHIDTASNYRKGRGEEAVGRALAKLRRDEVLVATKAGFVSTPELFRAAKELGARPEDFDKSGRHCIAPACLKASLDLSLRRLGVRCVDVLYLHNVCEKRSDLSTSQLLRLIRTAFEYLESERSNGRIRYYGLATFSATFRAAPGRPGALRLREEVFPLSLELNAKDPGFRYIQLPVTYDMPEAFVERYEPGGMTLNETAAELGISLVSSKSLGKRRKKNCIDDSTFEHVSSDPTARLLHLARSTPGLATALVGHKTPAHVRANLDLLKHPPLSPQNFQRAVYRCLN